MTDSKEQMLVDIKELAKLHGELPFIRIDRIGEILSTLPSEKEIAKGMWGKFEKDKKLFEAGKLPYFEFSFVRWLDNREIEHG